VADLLVLNHSEIFKRTILDHLPEVVYEDAEDVAGISVISRDQSSPVFIRYWTQQRGIIPTILVTFRHPNNADYKRTNTAMMKAVVNLLEQTQDDLVFYDDKNLTLRKAGKLTLQAHKYFWTPETLAMIPKPYEFEDPKS
jgi:hypothetical protein